MVTGTSLLVLLCAFATVVNFQALRVIQSQSRTKRAESNVDKKFSYIGGDHPLYMIDLEDFPRVVLDIEESTHYGLGPSAFDDWETFPVDEVLFKLGPDYRVFITFNSHIRHCMIRLHRALYPDLSAEKMSLGHAQHCLNLMRQMVLCNADLTLESPDVLSRDWTINRSGSTHVCRNWAAARSLARKQAENWRAFANASQLTD